MMTGDSVVLVNADKVLVTGRKKTDKLYHRYSGYPGGITTETFAKIIRRKPTFPLEHAIKGHAAQGFARATALPERQDLRRPDSSARGPAA